MQNNKISHWPEYIRWFIKQYQNLQSQTDVYRIVGCESEQPNQCQLIIQIVGKSTTFKCSPEEIVANDQMLELFSKKDIRTITYYACQDIKKPKYKIVLQNFSETLNRIVFGIRKRGSEEIIEKTADQISLDPNLLIDMTQQDAHLIGYTTATEQMEQEKIDIKKLTKNTATKPNLKILKLKS